MTSSNIYHYVYRITNVVEGKHYYGKRSSKIGPKLDLGKKYFSSSRDKQFIQDQINSARQLGYVQTILGRRRYLPDIHSANAIVRGQAERNAVNAPIQGSAADIIKIAMINIHRKILENKFKSRMLLQVHDELVFDCCLAEKEELTKIIKLEMENAFKLLVPLDVEIGEGNNWLEAH
jgi:DNA polymerase-1